jgi:cytochrome c6
MNSSEAIIAQVTNGKNAMPAFKGRLKPAQIEDVAAYVLDQANNKDWK